MNRRGFTLLELLASIGIAAISLVMLTGAVRSQGTSAIFQMGAADMQQNVRGALDLFRREVRMAGYGMSAVQTTTFPVLAIPAPGAGNSYRIDLHGNYNNVKNRVNASIAAGTTIIPMTRLNGPNCLPGTPPQSFTPGQRLAIESALLGVAEIRTISSYDAVNCNVTVTPSLVNPYDSGSPVNEIREVRYRLDDAGVLWRNEVVTADQINVMQMAYILNTGATVADPTAVLADLRSATIRMSSQEAAMRDGQTPKAELSTEVRIRNLAIVRTPAIDNL